MAGLVGILWAVVVIAVILWILGLVFRVAGSFIHVLLVIAIIVAIYNLVMGNRTA